MANELRLIGRLASSHLQLLMEVVFTYSGMNYDTIQNESILFGSNAENPLLN
jgi:hypothetical protein